jgi:hypothetical protein
MTYVQDKEPNTPTRHGDGTGDNRARSYRPSASKEQNHDRDSKGYNQNQEV